MTSVALTSGIDFGLGRFGDLRLQKGGPCCIRPSWNGLAPTFVDWLVGELGRFNSSASWTMRL
jgi:hypothetical protein